MINIVFKQNDPMTAGTPHSDLRPSPWVCRWSALVPGGSPVLDVACGRGRHMRWFAELGYRVTGIDHDADALAAASAWGTVVHADIENGPWPLAGQRFGAVVVTNYLWRPLLPTLLDAVAPGGVLIYETFADGNQTVGKPSRPDFLLQPGELLRTCASPDWRVVAYEDGFLDAPARFVQRIAAVRPRADAASTAPPRYPL